LTFNKLTNGTPVAPALAALHGNVHSNVGPMRLFVLARMRHTDGQTGKTHNAAA